MAWLTKFDVGIDNLLKTLQGDVLKLVNDAMPDSGLRPIRRCAEAAASGLCAVFALVATAQATVIWDFSYSGTFPNYGFRYGLPDTASGQLTTTDLNPVTHAYTITGITGLWNGYTITGLIPYGGNDDLLFAGSPLLDFNGLSFAAGGHDANLYHGYNGAYWDWVDFGSTLVNNGSFSVTELVPTTAVPEPTPVAVLGLSLAFLGTFGLGRRHARR
jgi:hypothetical protein